MNQLEQNTPKLKFWEMQRWADLEYNLFLSGDNENFHVFFDEQIENTRKTNYSKDERVIFLIQLLINNFQNGDVSKNPAEIDWTKQKLDDFKKAHKHQFSPKEDMKALMKSRDPYYLLSLAILSGIGIYLYFTALGIQNNQTPVIQNIDLALQDIESKLRGIEEWTQEGLVPQQRTVNIKTELLHSKNMFETSVSNARRALLDHQQSAIIFFLTLIPIALLAAEFTYNKLAPFPRGKSHYTFWNSITQPPINPEVKIIFDYLDKQIENSILKKSETKLKIN